MNERPPSTGARRHVLIEASRELAQSLDLEATIETIARLAVGSLADAVTIDIVAGDDAIERVTAAPDPARPGELQRDRRRYRRDHPDVAAIEAILRSEPPATRAAPADPAEGDRMSSRRPAPARRRASGLRVPLVAHGRALGAMTLVAGRRGYSAADRALAEDFAERCALALDNALLYRAAQAEIVARERLAAELRAGEALMRSLVENALDIISILRDDGTIAYESPAITAILGYQADELIGANAFSFVHPQDVQLVRERFGRLVAQPDGVEQVTFRFRHRDGSWRVLEAVGQQISRDPVSIVVNSRDITARQAAEERVRFQAHLLDVVGPAVVAADLRGRITYWNGCAAALLGWSADEARGRPIVTLTIAQSRQHIGEVAAQVAAGVGWSGELVLRRRDRTTLPAMVTISPLRDIADQVVGLVCVAVDISDRKRDEAERAILGETVALMEERERIAMELHDGVIQSLYGVTLALGAATRDRRADIDTVQATLRRTIRQVNDVIRDLRDYVHNLRPAGRDGAEVRAGIQILGQQLTAAGIRPELDLEPAALAALRPAMAAHVLQVAREAVSNAIRHADPVRVQIRLTRADDRVMLIVRDDGRGLGPSSELAREGQGLGNMFERARALGGRVTIQNGPLGGVEVTLEVPLQPESRRS